MIHDHTMEEDVSRLIGRVRHLSDLAAALERELRVLHDRCRRRPRPEADLAHEEEQRPRAVRRQEGPGPEVPAQGFVDLVDPDLQELLRPPPPDLPDEDNAGAAPSRDPAEASTVGYNSDAHEPEFDSHLEEFKILVYMGERGRQMDLSYVGENNDVADVHYEVARITKRAAWSFVLKWRDADAVGTVPLRLLGEQIVFRGVQRSDEERASACPPSAHRRGGAASSIRSKLARKLAKADPAVPGALQLIQLLWPTESQQICELRGSPQMLADVITGLAKKHHIHYTRSGWVMEEPAIDDPLLTSDPWARASSAAAKTDKKTIPIHRDDDIAPTSYETSKLITRFVIEDKTELKQCARLEYVVGSDAVILCSNQHLRSFMASVGTSVHVMLLVDKLSRDHITKYEAKRTQILVDNEGSTKVLNVCAISLSSQRISAIQEAWKVDITEADVVWGSSKILRDHADSQNFDQAHKKEWMAQVFGPLYHTMGFTNRRVNSEEGSIRWTLEIPRGSLEDVLACSGKCDLIVTVPREQEQQLAVHPVFVDSISITKLFELVQNVPHLRIAGPTRNGSLLVRAKPDQIAEIRRIVLNPTSAFAKVWDLTVVFRYQGKFNRKYSLQTAATSLRTSLGWDCVGIAQKAATKTHRWYTFGSATKPPVDRVVIDQELILLKETSTHKEEKLATSFVPGNCLLEKEEGEAAMEESTGVTELIDEACSRNFSNSEKRLESRLTTWQKTVQQKLDETIQSFKTEVKEAVQVEAAKSSDNCGRIEQELAKQAALIHKQNQTSDAAWKDIDSRMAQMAKTTEERFISVDKSLTENAQLIASSNTTLQEQFRSLGAELMAQIASLHGDGTGKKRRAEEDAHMGHHGGMIDPEKLGNLAEKLKAVLVKHNLASNEKNDKPTEAPIMGPMVSMENDEGRVATSSSNIIATTRSPDQQLSRSAASTDPPPHLRAVSRPRADCLQQDTTPLASLALRTRTMHAEARREDQEAPRLQNWGDRVPPTIDPDEKATNNVLKLTGVKCNEANAVDVADDLASSWRRALDEGLHVWTLHDGEHSVADSADLHELTKAPVRKKMKGYHLRCWTCGLCHSTSRRKAVMSTGCAATRLMNKDCTTKGRVMSRHWSLAAFKADLDTKNKDPARSHLHWPECIAEPGAALANWLRCTKCGFKVPASRSSRILQGVCDQDSERLRRVLQPDLRGGQQAKFASFNIGTLRDREADLAALDCQILAVQETNIPKPLWKSVAARLRQLNGTIVFGGQRECDTRKRKHHEGVRLGTGIALIAFEPWSMHKVDALWPPVEVQKQIDHRLVSGLAVCGTKKVLCHGIYLDPQTRDLDDLIFQELSRRIGLSSHARHLVAGDWQTDSRTTLLGRSMQHHGWLSWSRLMENGEATNTPPKGIPRLLDDIWLSANTMGYCTKAENEQLPGWSTHNLISLTCSFDQETIEGNVVKRGMSTAQVEEAIENAYYPIWDQPVDWMGSTEELYKEWTRRLCIWLRLTPGTIGDIKWQSTKDDCTASGPIKPRVLQRQNIARKTQAYIEELAAIGQKAQGHELLNARSIQLVKAIQRAPWDAWDEQWPLLHLPHPRTWRDLHPLLQWLAQTWPATYQRVASRSRQTLTQWRLQTQDSIAEGKLGKLSKWIKGPTGLPVLEVEGELICHPQQVGVHLRRSWGDVYCPEQCTPMQESELDMMTYYLPRYNWEPNDLTVDQLKHTAMHRKATSAGPDKITLKMYQHLPDAGWQMLVHMLNLIESGQPWPSPLLKVAMTTKRGLERCCGAFENAAHSHHSAVV